MSAERPQTLQVKFRQRWDSYAARPPLNRRVFRIGLTIGYCTGFAIVAVVVLAFAAVVVVCCGAFGVWLDT